MYPNPANNNFVLLYSGSSAKDILYKISDVLGNEIKTGIINPNVAHEINAERFSNGIYFITLIQANKVIEKKKLIIMK